jgi:hypothetical protein
LTYITGGRYGKIYKIPPSEMVWSCGMFAKPTDVKIAIVRMEGTRKRGIHRKIWSNEREDDGNIMGTKHRQVMDKGHQRWLYWSPRPTMDRSA